MLNTKDIFTNDPIRVMVVDDSSIIRNFLVRELTADPEITVITTAANGSLALNYVSKYDVEILILDIEMPQMDGLTALPKLLQISPNIKIIMVSSLTHKNAPVAIKALSLGASDYIEKPSAITSSNNLDYFNADLINKVKSLAYSSRINKEYQKKTSTHHKDVHKTAPVVHSHVGPSSHQEKHKHHLNFVPSAIAIACSTGGPQALQKFFSNLKLLNADLGVPIFITQHMPAVFTSYLAEHIKEASGNLLAKEAQDGDIVNSRGIYIAPGDFHMLINKNGNEKTITLTKDEPENYCRPSADPMLRSLVKIYKDRLLTIVFSGMGVDGLKGSQKVVEAGGAVIAQDEQTSVVWGMPGAVTKAGLTTAVLPIDQIASYVSLSMENRNEIRNEKR